MSYMKHGFSSGADKSPGDINRYAENGNYRDHVYSRILYFSRLGSLLAFILIPLFILLDMFIFRAPIGFVYFRIVPLIPALVILVSLKTPLARARSYIKSLYMVFLLSLMVMMSGIVGVSAPSSYYEGTMLGLLIVIFAVFLGYRGNIMNLTAVLLAPIVALTVYMALESYTTAVRIWFMVTPFAETFVVIIIAMSQQKMRRRQFEQRQVIERQNRELRDSYRLIEEKSAQMRDELRLALGIQHSLIPNEPPRIPGVLFDSAYLPVVELGGDMYDFISLGETGRTGILISDVSGHGVPAALIAAMVKTLVHNAGQEKNNAAGFLSYLNARMIGLVHNNFITALYGIYDPVTRVLRFARAGHPYPCLIEAGGAVRELRSEGRFLGVMHNLCAEECSVELKPGDKVLFFTDGLVEAENSRGELFETILFGDILPLMGGVPVRSMITTIIESLYNFCGERRMIDDICIVVMEAVR